MDKKEENLITSELQDSNENVILKKEKKKMKFYKKVLIIVGILMVCGFSSLGFLLYGPWPNFRNWLITTAMTTMSHQYLATWFYDDKTIDDVLKQNIVIESGEETDINQVNIATYKTSSNMFLNKYEKEILTKDEGNDVYKLVYINENKLRGYLVAIYDPSKVQLATATTLGTTGQKLTTIAKDNNAVVAMNASGFSDPNYNGNGGTPTGIVIKDGQLIHGEMATSGSVIGFTNDNKLVLGKMTAGEAINAGIKDAVDFGPFLIVNGKPSYIKGNGGWGSAQRSAIGQRQDGIVLFLVMDGRDYASGIPGADMSDLTEILLRYGAYNAANLDGGQSSGLAINGEMVNKQVNAYSSNLNRAIPDAWIVTK